MKNKMMKGKKIKNVPAKADSSLDCFARCDTNSKCKGFSFVEKHKKKNMRNRCFLYSKIKKMVKKKGYVSAEMGAQC